MCRPGNDVDIRIQANVRSKVTQPAAGVTPERLAEVIHDCVQLAAPPEDPAAPVVNLVQNRKQEDVSLRRFRKIEKTVMNDPSHGGNSCWHT